MGVLGTYVLCLVAPAASFYAFSKAAERFTAATGWGRRGSASPAGPSLERLVSDLRRLQSDYLRIQRSDLPARMSRLQCVSLAYDDTLRACCLAVGVPQPGRPPFGSFVRLQIEAALAQHGLVW